MQAQSPSEALRQGSRKRPARWVKIKTASSLNDTKLVSFPNINTLSGWGDSTVIMQTLFMPEVPMVSHSISSSTYHKAVLSSALV